MKKFRLELALNRFGEEIKSFEFKTLDELTHKCLSDGLDDNSIFVCSVSSHDHEKNPINRQYENEILISQNYNLIMEWMEIFFVEYCGGFVFFQEYTSFEDAYRVALHMKEPNPNCYN